MKAVLFALCLGLALPAAQATDRWRFDSRIEVTAEPVAGVFTHLEGAGRKHIAVSKQSIAVVWEDDRSRDPQIYVAQKSFGQQRFSTALQVSDGNEAYEPAIAALSDAGFVLAWEQDGAVFARLLSAGVLAPALKLSHEGASHATAAAFGERIFVAWREQRDRDWFLQLAVLRQTDTDDLEIESSRSIESAGLKTPVLYPALAVNRAGLSIAWEDRRAGHTRLLYSHADRAGKNFSEPRFLNEFFSNRNQYDQGSGVTRVALAAFADDELLAAWMDKRRGGLGYGIFTALGADGDFGPNEKAHGEQGDKQPHYNPATAGNPAGDFVVAWDDFRRGDSDIWISSYDADDEWSLDHSPRVASGAGEQSHPSIALDTAGNLHLLWMERSELDAPGRLWYSRGLRNK